MKISEQFAGRFLKSSELVGKQLHATIAAVELEEFEGRDGATQAKPVLTFSDHDRGMVLNRTNAEILASHWGDETDAWIDQRVTIRTHKVRGPTGSLVDGLVIAPWSAPVPKAAPAGVKRPVAAPASAAAAVTEDDLSY